MTMDNSSKKQEITWHNIKMATSGILAKMSIIMRVES
jgi:hypothetical protein